MGAPRVCTRMPVCMCIDIGLCSESFEILRIPKNPGKIIYLMPQSVCEDRLRFERLVGAVRCGLSEWNLVEVVTDDVGLRRG